MSALAIGKRLVSLIGDVKGADRYGRWSVEYPHWGVTYSVNGHGIIWKQGIARKGVLGRPRDPGLDPSLPWAFDIEDRNQDGIADFILQDSLDDMVREYSDPAFVGRLTLQRTYHLQTPDQALTTSISITPEQCVEIELLQPIRWALLARPC